MNKPMIAGLALGALFVSTGVAVAGFGMQQLDSARRAELGRSAAGAIVHYDCVAQGGAGTPAGRGRDCDDGSAAARAAR